MVRPLLLTTAFFLVTGATAFAGCSSSSNGGTPNDAGHADTSTGHDSGSSSGSSSSGSSSGSGDDSGGDDGSTAAACPATAAIPTLPTFTAPTKGQAKCQATDIQGFIAACLATGATNTTCNTWFTANSALASADGGGGTACGNCLFDPNNPDVGGLYWSPTAGQSIGFAPNYGGCIALVDTTNGPACAAALDNFNFCDEWFCGDCASSATTTSCESGQNAAGAACGAYSATYQGDGGTGSSPCDTDLADGGIGNTTCSPSTVNNDTTGVDDFGFIANLICGDGSTTFNPDSGL